MLINLFPAVIQKKGRILRWRGAEEGCLSLSRRVGAWGFAPQNTPVNTVTLQS